MDALIAASREFFHKPLAEKQAYSNLIEGKKWQLEGYGNDPRENPGSDPGLV